MSYSLTNPRVTKLERCMEFLKMLPSPLFPRESEVLKIVETVGCNRITVYRARDELKMRHILLYGESGVTLVEPKNVKNVTLRSVNHELMSHFKWFYDITYKKTVHGVKFDPYEQRRHDLIRGLLGYADTEEVGK